MSAKHWIRDLQITFAAATYGIGQVSYVLYHFLANAGWTWLWECDGYAGDSPNRVVDGNMELAAAAPNWAAVGTAVVDKATTPVWSGTQALAIESHGAGDGVESTDLTSMENTTTYHLAIWARNNSGQPWDVQVDGGGGYASVGSIAHGGTSYTLTHFDFTTAGGGTRKIKILDGTGTSGTIHISDILVVRSYFYANPSDVFPSGTDGVVAATDQISSLSYSFVAGDIGKVICIWDAANPKNSGAWKITGAAAGVATVDMRSGSAAFVGASSLSWRMIDLAAAPENAGGAVTSERGAGFGLQSPHSSGWRLFVRQSAYGGAGHSVCGIWGAPLDTDFDFSTGTFYTTGSSTQKIRQAAYAIWTNGAATWPNMHYWYFGQDTAKTQRLYLMTDADGSFVTMFLRDTGGSNYHDSPFIGYLGSSVYMPGERAWALFARWNSWTVNTNGIYWDGAVYRTYASGTMIGHNSLAYNAVWGQLGYGAAALCPITQSNARSNAFSGEEWLYRVIALRDPRGSSSSPAEMISDVGIYQGRINMTAFTTINSNNYLHLHNGVCWEWMGESVVP